ncbi:hypothetical protein V4100_000985 [Pseudomonas aeruginosa]
MKLLIIAVLMTLSTLTIASEEPKQFAPFSIVTKEVSDKLNSDYNSMIDSIIHISKRTDYAYTEADIKKAATIVATEYSPCKYTQRIDVLECQSTRDDLISYLTDSVMKSTTFKDLKKVDVLDEAVSILYEDDRKSLSDRVKAILKKGKINGNGKVTFENTNDKYAVMLIATMLSNETVSNIYEEILLDDYKAAKIQQDKRQEEAINHAPPSIIKPLTLVSNTLSTLFEAVNEAGLSEKRYSCKYDEDEMTIQCRHDYKYIYTFKLSANIWPLVMFLVILVILISRSKEKKEVNKEK